MTKQTVYLDSTIPSYYFDERETTKTFSDLTRKWWDNERHEYDLWLSKSTMDEIIEGNYPNRNKVIELANQFPILEDNFRVREIAKYYIQNKLMPKELDGDASHLAYASFYGFDFLLTWNCNHLANANKFKHIRQINNELKISTPEIITPMQLIKEL